MGGRHTAGPWELGQTPCYETALVAPGVGRVVAFAAWDGGSGCHLEIENEADALVIVTAPELLAHLQFAVKLLAPWVGGTAQVEAMRKTIAKATGAA